MTWKDCYTILIKKLKKEKRKEKMSLGWLWDTPKLAATPRPPLSSIKKLIKKKKNRKKKVLGGLWATPHLPLLFLFSLEKKIWQNYYYFLILIVKF